MHYIAIDDPGNLQSIPANLDVLIGEYRAAVEWVGTHAEYDKKKF